MAAGTVGTTSSCAGEEGSSDEISSFIASWSLVDDEKSTRFLTGAVAGTGTGFFKSFVSPCSGGVEKWVPAAILEGSLE
jgi:hypothetical protein